jgi:hypothetical protein
MVALIPVIVLVLGALLIQLFGRRNMRPGTSWLVASISALTAWIALIPIGILLPDGLTIDHWIPESFQYASIAFKFTPQNWMLGFLISSLALAVIFSEAKNLSSTGYINRLSSSLFLTGLGILAIAAGSELTFLLVWALIDLVEFGVLSVIIGRQKSLPSAAASISIRFIGILMLLILIILGSSGDQGMRGADLTPAMGWLLVLLIVARMGILPLFQPYAEDPIYQRGLITIIRALPLITSFAFMFFISRSESLAVKTGLIFFVLTVTLIYGAVSWVNASNELKGRPYWNLSIAAMGLLVFLTDRTSALTGLAILQIATGSALFLYSPRFKKPLPFLFLLILGLLPFPFNPASTITTFFTAERVNLVTIIWLVAYVLLLCGVIKHSLRKDESSIPIEPWMGLFHAIALFLLVLAPLMVVLLQFQTLQLRPALWSWLTIIGLVILLSLFTLHFVHLGSYVQSRFARTKKVFTTSMHYLEVVLNLSWLGKLISSLGFIVEKIVHLLSRVLEGEGGILWSFLFIILFLSLIFSRQVP